MKVNKHNRLQLFLSAVCYFNQQCNPLLHLGNKEWLDIAPSITEQHPEKHTYQGEEHVPNWNHLQRKKGNFKYNAKTELVLDYFTPNAPHQ